MAAPIEETWGALNRPRTLIIAFHLFAPILASPLMATEALASGDPVRIARGLLALYVPFTGIPLALRVVHHRVRPMLERSRSAARQWLLRGLVTTGTPIVAALPLKPLHDLVAGAPERWLEWLATAVIITWLLALPTLVMEEVRARAEKAALLQHQAALRAQLEAVQARTNPHFLFNSLNVIAELIHQDPVQAERTLERVAAILRYSLASRADRLVRLGEELSVVEDYLAIQRTRFGPALQTSMEVEPGIEELLIPPLALQPLVENAIVHGGRSRSAVWVRVSARRSEDGLEVAVEDDGPGPGGSTHRGTGTALRDLEARLGLVYQGAARLQVGPRAGGGFVAQVYLPALRGEP